MLNIEKYYDIRCDKCGMSRSADIDGGLGLWLGTDRAFRQSLKREGWREKDGFSLCPDCVAKMEETK